MATVSSNHHSQRITAAAEIGSPKSRRSSSAREVCSPWIQIVRGGEWKSVPVATASGAILQFPHSPSANGSFSQQFPSRPFIPPTVPPMRIIYPEVASSLFYVTGPPPESFRLMPMLCPMSPVFYHVPADPQLHNKMVNQIDYYFSKENLIKDMFLRENMDDQGWVPIKLIAGFKKVSQLTSSIHIILDALQTSSVVEVQGDKLRRRNDWMKWIVPPSMRYSSVSSPYQAVQNSSSVRLAGLKSKTAQSSQQQSACPYCFTTNSHWK